MTEGLSRRSCLHPQPGIEEPVLRSANMPHQPRLDGLRAVAIVIVFASHAGLGNIVPGGFGVTIFFFLSGYLITTLIRFEMADIGRINFRGFYFRRALRIFPSLYLTMIFAIGLQAAGLLPNHLDAKSIVVQAAFLSNYGKAFGGFGDFALPLWSLAVEEHFYLIFPVLFSTLIGRSTAANAAAVCVVACIAVLGVRVSYAFSMGAYDTGIWTHTRIDSILYGCCLALWRNPLLDGPTAYRPKTRHVLSAVILVAVTLIVRNELFRETLRYSLQGCALFVLFAAILTPVDCDKSVGSTIVRFLSSRLLGRIGLYSYTLYLVHFIMLDLAGQIMTSQVGQAVLACALSVLYADAMYRCVERPANRLRARSKLRSDQHGRRLMLEKATVQT